MANCDLLVDAILGTGFKPAGQGAICRGDRSDEQQRQAGRCGGYSFRGGIRFDAPQTGEG